MKKFLRDTSIRTIRSTGMFDKREIELLNVAYQAFVSRAHLFDVLSPEDWENTGIENWVQTELMIALIDRDYDVTTVGKRERDCDIIVEEKESGLNVGLEIKAFTCDYYRGLINEGIERHPKADLYLFLCQATNTLLSRLEGYFKKHGYIQKKKMIFNNWMVMLVKKSN